MKICFSQTLKLILLFGSSATLVSGLYLSARAHGQAEFQPRISQAPLAKTVQNLSQPFELNPKSQSDEIHQSLAPKQAMDGDHSVAAILCIDLPQWRRPSEQTQRKRLQQMDRYEGFFDDEVLVSLAKDWWTHEIFSFTTYGLSARTDPHYLSGVWTALDEIWTCYEGEEAQHINSGEVAELWLINHRLVDIAWQDSQYVVTVEPSHRGLQLVHFDRTETYENLPLVVTTQDGTAVSVMSGDW
jgi:hypothetical protein